jgi:hypothetical protein
MSTFDGHSEIDEHVLKTLLYFDIFNYPLTSQEVFNFLGLQSATNAEVNQSIKKLTEEGLIYDLGDFHSAQCNKDLVTRRLKGNQMAEKTIPLAKKQAALIAKFPFVRAVLASGSLSKKYMDDSSDLDFFIVTCTNRIWIARLFLAIYKRVFLFNSHKHFCTNYFVDETHLEIEEKNLFTATELGTLIPLYNSELYNRLLEANGWIHEFLPHIAKDKTVMPAAVTSWAKKAMEWITNANWLDDFSRKLTVNRLKRIYGKKISEPDFQIAFKSKKSVSKNHPRQYQKKVLEMYNRKVIEFNTRHSMLLQ